MRVLRQAGVVRRRLDLNAGSGVRKVEVARGRAGYGFTMSGQAPCLLSGILKGSPADLLGLRPGDCILSVNESDVSEASHEAVVKLIGTSSGPLCLVVVAGGRPHVDSCSSDEELAFHGKENAHWLKPENMDSKSPGLHEEERVETRVQPGQGFDAFLEHSGPSSCSSEKNKQSKQRPVSEPDLSYWARQGPSKSNPGLLSEEETVKIVSTDSVFTDLLQNPNDFLPDASILNMGMIVGYISSVELNLMTSDTEEDSLQAIRGCISHIGIEQKAHSLVMMRITCDSVQLCDDTGAVLAAYPVEHLAMCAICPDDQRFFGLVSMDAPNDHGLTREEESLNLKTSCHVFFVDPELYDHEAHRSITGHFGFECTPDPDTHGCLEFPQTPHSILQFVTVLYCDMGDFIERLRAKLDRDDVDDGQQNARHSGSGDSGIGNGSPGDQGSRDLLVDSWNHPVAHLPNHLWEKPPPYSALYGSLRKSEPSTEPEAAAHVFQPPLPVSKPSHSSSQRWPSASIRARWQRSRQANPEPYADVPTSRPKAKSRTLPPAMDQIPAHRYTAPEAFIQPRRAATLDQQQAKKLFGRDNEQKHRDGESKGSRFWGFSRGHSSGRHTSGHSRRLSLARSLDDLESAAASDSEMRSVELQGCGSESSLNSNGSLPSVHSHRRLSERRVASWAACFERLLQDPVGVRYFSEFLKKEFSEENILFWQACEFFSQVPENDKKQLSQKAREIYNSFLSSKATTPVNIDSQAQLADNVLTAPQPNMFKQQQLQIFNLMKFDSYSRFLKSSLYQECMLAEVEGRPLPDPYQIPCSPAPSKHSFNSDRSTLSTPKKEFKKPKPGRSSDDIRDEHADKKKGTFFSWSRNRSFGKGPKKRDLGDFSYPCNGRRESQGSLSSSASQELNTSCTGGKNECDFRSSMAVWERDRERWPRQCSVALPDGSCSSLALRHGTTVRQVLLDLCHKQHINLAAVDLFLIGGEKPLVLDQDSMTLSSRDLRLEKRTLFRLDLVPINRSVGLKAKPTKPVTEVLRPVVAKYGLRLGDLVARISGEAEALDLGVPISNLDGLRVVLERADPASAKADKSKATPSKTHAPPLTNRSLSTPGDDRSSGKPLRGESGGASEKRKLKKTHIDEVEEFFELLSRAQSSRADDQRGLLRKEDLVLPDFLRLTPDAPACSTPASHKPGHAGLNGARRLARPTLRSESLDCGPSDGPFRAPLSPVLRSAGPRGPEEEALDLTLVGEGDISSPNCTLLPLSPSPALHEGSSLPEADFTPPPPAHLPGLSPQTSPHSRLSSFGTENGDKSCTPASRHQRAPTSGPHLTSTAQEGSPSSGRVIDVEEVRLEENPELSQSFEGYVADLRQCQSRMRNGKHPADDLPSLLGNQPDGDESGAVQYKATFV